MPKRDLVRRANANPGSGSAGAPGASTIIVMQSGTPTTDNRPISNVDTVDGYHVSPIPIAGTLLPLDGEGNLVTHSILPETSQLYDLGSPSLLWHKAYIGEVDTIVFALNTQTLQGGRLVVGHGAGALGSDVAAADTVVDFGQEMTPGDWVLFRGLGQVECMLVGALESETSYAVTRDVDGSGANDWPRGTPYLVLGAEHDGRIELVASDGTAKPHIAIREQGADWNTYTDRVRIGDLNGSFGIASELYGLGVGDYAGGNYMRYDGTNGFVVRAGDDAFLINTDGVATLDGKITAGSPPPDGLPIQRQYRVVEQDGSTQALGLGCYYHEDDEADLHGFLFAADWGTHESKLELGLIDMTGPTWDTRITITSGVITLGNDTGDQVWVPGRLDPHGGILNCEFDSLRNASFTLNDDTATSFTPAHTQGVMIVNSSGNGEGGVFIYKVGAGNFISSGLNLNGTDSKSTALTGTTGTDDRMSVSACSDGKLYIENRRGGTRTITVTLLGA